MGKISEEIYVDTRTQRIIPSPGTAASCEYRKQIECPKQIYKDLKHLNKMLTQSSSDEIRKSE